MVCDATSLLNVIATGCASEILGDRRLLLAPAVRAQPLFLYVGAARETRLSIDEAMISGERVLSAAVAMSEEEVAAAVSLGVHMDDGEAQTLAVAGSRAVAALSDDPAAARAAPALGIPVETTLDLLFAWSTGKDPEHVALAVRSLRLRANYVPPRNHPLLKWFGENCARSTGVSQSCECRAVRTASVPPTNLSKPLRR